MPSNSSRRKAALAALKTFAQEKDGAVKPGWKPCQEDVVDFLTDLRHYCHGQECSFDDAVRISQYHFQTEKDKDA